LSLYASIVNVTGPPRLYFEPQNLFNLDANPASKNKAVAEIIDPVFAKTSQNARFLLSEYERFGLVFTKTPVYKFGHRSTLQIWI
jgi:hypothetical protein